MPLLDKVQPIMQAGLWCSGAIALIIMIFKRRSWKDVLLTLLSISLASAFIYDPKNIYDFGATAAKGATSLGRYVIDILNV